ncbi:MAG TPA: two-component system response regulator [Candidatus Cloacimonas sp.]|jgi:two-component system response regulator|nr:hypothetical protein [Candidatus Cloacimonadota bacterium]HCX73995.1 two-component system response regulator [Candidatus Cloacimonas sp.]
MVPTHPSIIWVEDDDNDITLFKRAFSKTQINNPLKIFKTAEATLQYLEKIDNADEDELPILIFLDIKLPGESGLKVLEWLRQHEKLKQTPVIIFSSSKETKDVIQAYNMGANSYVTKPHNYNELKDFVELIQKYWLRINQHPHYLYEADK